MSNFLMSVAGALLGSVFVITLLAAAGILPLGKAIIAGTVGFFISIAVTMFLDYRLNRKYPL